VWKEEEKKKGKSHEKRKIINPVEQHWKWGYQEKGSYIKRKEDTYQWKKVEKRRKGYDETTDHLMVQGKTEWKTPKGWVKNSQESSNEIKTGDFEAFLEVSVLPLCEITHGGGKTQNRLEPSARCARRSDNVNKKRDQAP